MADKITPATKPVPRGDGFKLPSAHSTLTTGNDNEGRIWNRNNGETDKLFSKSSSHSRKK